MAKASVQLDDEDALMDRIDQKKKLDKFINRWFHDTEEGTLKAAFHPFESASEFELVLERHLRKVIQKALPESAVDCRPSTSNMRRSSSAAPRPSAMCSTRYAARRRKAVPSF
jgi:hypothetical protein